jgi:hypothetical protein
VEYREVEKIEVSRSGEERGAKEENIGVKGN